MTSNHTRRALLAAAGAAGLAGCLDGLGLSSGSADESQSDDQPAGDSEDATGGETSDPLAAQGRPADICRREPRDLGLVPITEPDIAPAEAWPGYDIGPEFELVETGEPDSDVVIGVERDGVARAYPLATLWWSEVINDELGGPIAVTYCPLCRSGLATTRRVQGTTTILEASGLLWQPPDRLYPSVNETGDGVLGGGPEDETAAAFRDNRHNLVLTDAETGSYWSQLLGRAICGPATGEELSPVAATMATLGEWRASHPETTVVLPVERMGVPPV